MFLPSFVIPFTFGLTLTDYHSLRPSRSYLVGLPLAVGGWQQADIY